MLDIYLLPIGLILGIVASFIAWWLIIRFFRSSIKFSSNISKILSRKKTPKYIYRIKFENTGRRKILDLEIVAKLRIRELKRSFKDNWEVVYIPLINNNIPKFSPVRKSKSRTIVTLLLNETQDFSKSIFPKWVQNKYLKKSILLEDLFKLGTKATLQVYGFGHDEFSGNRRIFESKIYSKDDIKDGYFDKKGLNVIETYNS